MTKKIKKILLVVIASILAIIIALAVFIKIYMTPERVKAFLIPAVEKALNRKVNIGGINISLFKGIEVKDFAIKEKDEKTDFVACRNFVLKYQLLPLLSKKIIIDELKLLSPEIRIERDSEGKFNFEGIGQEQKPAGPAKEEQLPEAKGPAASLLINRVIIQDAGFSFSDLKKELPDIKGSVNIEMDLKSTAKNELSSTGDINLKFEDIFIKKPSEKHIRDINAGLKYDARINLESFGLDIHTADLKIQGIPLKITGNFLNLRSEPAIDLEIQLPKTKISDIQKAFSSYADTDKLSLSGNTSLNLKLSGIPKNSDSLKADGIILLEKAGITYAGVNAVFDGNLKFNKQKMDIDLNGAIGKNTAKIKGSVRNYFKNQEIILNLYSKQLFLDELMPAGIEKSPVPAPPSYTGAKNIKVDTDSTLRAEKEAKPLNLSLTASGEIKIDSARYKGMTASDFYLKYLLKNKKFEIEKMTARAGKGDFSLYSITDMSIPGYTYSLSGNIKSLHAEEIVNTFFPKAKDTVFGIISSNFKMSGAGLPAGQAGTLSESIKRNLVADTDFNIKDGKITNNKMAENLALLLGIDELKTINLKQANGTVKIRDGIARLDSIFASDDIAMDPKGNIGLDETINLEFDLKLSPRLTDKATRNAGIAKYIKDDAGWGRIPLRVSGTFSNPSYNVDIAKAGERVIEKEVDKFIDKLFKKDTDKKAVDDKTQQDKKSVEDLLKDVFK
ncbi:MAG: AsmA family protein [Nitrospirota bacterium]